jgi:hypothetical protein
VAPLTVVFSTPVDGSMSEIAAPETTAPVWSVIMPVIFEFACPNAVTHPNIRTKTDSKALRQFA